MRGRALADGLVQLLFGPPAPLKRRNVALLLLCAALAALLCLVPSGPLSNEEERAWERVRAAQDHLASCRTARGMGPSTEDPFSTGLIGVEWSPLTTTLGSLPSKQASTNPVWAVLFLRWFDRLGLKSGDRVAFLSSASFPGLLLSGLAAAEERGLDVLLIASLGASTWGANEVSFPLPVILSELRLGGYLSTKAAFYSLGGDDERGGGFPEEGAAILKESAEAEGVPLVFGLASVVEAKEEALRAFSPHLVVQIGGGRANLGDDEVVLSLPPGLLDASFADRGGNGLIASALQEGWPVLHLLNLAEVARREGIPFDGRPVRRGPAPFRRLRALAGGALFLLLLVRYRRWELSD